MKNDKRSEQEAWIKAHGSERLRKAVQLGMLDVCQGVYRDERVHEKFPGWLCGVGAKFSPILNPTLPELDLLGHVRKSAPDAILEKVLRHDRWVSVVTMERIVLDIGDKRRSEDAWIEGDVGPVKLFTYCDALAAFAHTGELPPKLRRPPKD